MNLLPVLLQVIKLVLRTGACCYFNQIFQCVVFSRIPYNFMFWSLYFLLSSETEQLCQDLRTMKPNLTVSVVK